MKFPKRGYANMAYTLHTFASNAMLASQSADYEALD